MNNVTLIGRMVKDPEVRSTTSGISVCTFTIAVDRRYKSEGQPEVDFIPIVAWRSTADFVSKYFRKGNRIALTGSIQIRSWEDKDGNKRYATEVIADGVEFCESKKNDNPYEGKEAGLNDGMMPPPSAPEAFYPLNDETDIPF